MGDRYLRTTEHLRQTALSMLLERGSRAFSVESLARAADVGIGTVYERWDNRLGVLDDVIGSMLLVRLRQTRDALRDGGLAERLASLLDSEDGGDLLVLASEVLFGCRDMPELKSLTIETVEVVREMMSDDDLAPVDGAMNWWLTALAFGWAILRTGRASVPAISGDVLFVLSGSESGVDCVRPDKPWGYAGQFIDRSAPEDDIAISIVRIAKELLSSADGPSFSAREVGRRAGISKGALYRRYGSRADVIRGVLLTDLDEQRFAWSNELLEVLAGDDPVDDAAEAMGKTLRRVYEDEPMMRRLLEVTVAARADEAIRANVISHIHNAVEERLGAIRSLQDTSIVKRGISAEGLSWFIQAVPIGTRLMSSVGFRPEAGTVSDALRTILRVCVNMSAESPCAETGTITRS